MARALPIFVDVISLGLYIHVPKAYLSTLRLPSGPSGPDAPPMMQSFLRIFLLVMGSQKSSASKQARRLDAWQQAQVCPGCHTPTQHQRFAPVSPECGMLSHQLALQPPCAYA